MTIEEDIRKRWIKISQDESDEWFRRLAEAKRCSIAEAHEYMDACHVYLNTNIRLPIMNKFEKRGGRMKSILLNIFWTTVFWIGLFILVVMCRPLWAADIDTLRVDLPNNQVRDLYGCWTYFDGLNLSADCAGTYPLTGGAYHPETSAGIINFSVASDGFEWWTEYGQCTLIYSGIGSIGETQYEVRCGDIISHDGFEG